MREFFARGFSAKHESIPKSAIRFVRNDGELKFVERESEK